MLPGRLVLDDQQRAEDPEDRARRADGDPGRRRDQRAGRAGEARDDVERQVAEDVRGSARRARRASTSASMFSADVKQVRVQERGRDQPPPVAVRDGRPEEHPLREELAAGAVDPASLRDGDQVDEDVQRRSAPTSRTAARLRDSERIERRRRSRAARAPARRDVGCALRRVVGTAGADGRHPQAFGADRPLALRAREARLAVGMAVAVDATSLVGCVFTSRSRPPRRRRRRSGIVVDVLPRDVDDRAGARRRATSASSAAGRSTRRAGCARASRIRSSAASANAVRIDGFDVGASPREFLERRARDADPLDDERDERDPRGRRAL